MALGSILRKSASTLSPLAGRLVRAHRNYHSFIFPVVNHRTHLLCNPVVPSFQFSSSKLASSDESLVRVIESEIKCAEESDDHDRAEEIPSGFPFEIEDKQELQVVTLKRTYQGEDITVEVHMPDLVTREDDGDGGRHDESEKASQSSVPLVVSVSKKNGPSLEFTCSAYPDEIAIDSLAVKHPQISEDQIAYEGPDFQDLDENLQKAFHKYLEIRGIKPSTTNFLHEYMINKDSREYLVWLQKLEKFVRREHKSWVL